jgi:hypothetical protein
MTAICEQHVCIERPALMTAEATTAVQLNLIQQVLIVSLDGLPAAKTCPIGCRKHWTAARTGEHPPVRDVWEKDAAKPWFLAQ